MVFVPNLGLIVESHGGFMKKLILVLIFCPSITFAASYNFVQCMFEKIDGEWIYIFSSSYSSPFEIEEGEQYPLGNLTFLNPQQSQFQESSLCSHVNNSYMNGSLDVVTYIHNADYFEELTDSFTCTWEATNLKLQVREEKNLKKGEHQSFKYQRLAPANNEVYMVNYLPTDAEIKILDPDLAEEICFKYEP